MFNGINKKFQAYVQKKMEGYVVSYFQAHPEVKLIVVSGSVGKTSTKNALSVVLGRRFRMRVHEGNHNTFMSVPLSILGIPYPEHPKSIGEWRDVFHAAEAKILQAPDVDVIVQDISADYLGEVSHFASYLQPDIAIITAVTLEHMDEFKSVESIAQEELAAANFSKLALINRDDIDGQFASYLTNSAVDTYGTSEVAEYHFVVDHFSSEEGHVGYFVAPELHGQPVTAAVKVVGEHNIRPAVAAATAAIKLGVAPQDIAAGLDAVRPIPGRMCLLEGANDSTIIDDTYSSNPESAVAAIETFYSMPAAHRIVVLGSMNELGSASPTEHQKLGRMFRPDTVDWVITVGEDANKYLADAAHSQGCQIKTCDNAVQAGAFAHSVLQPGSLVLVKGSQDGSYLEETVKVLLRHPEQGNMLVRQSSAWMAHKENYFSTFQS